MFGDQFVEHGGVRRQIVGVEGLDVHGVGAGRPQRGNLAIEAIGAAGGQHHGGVPAEPQRQLAADLASAAENHHYCRSVCHAGDYHLR